MVEKTSEVAESMEASLSTQTDEIERLKKQKRVLKTQLSKLYTKLLRLMTDDSCENESLIQGLEAYEDKKAEVLTIIDVLATAYKKAGDDRNAVKTEDEIDLVTSETNRDAATIKSYISATVIKESKSESLTSRAKQSDEQQQLRDEPGKTKSKAEVEGIDSWRELRCIRDDYEAKSSRTVGVDQKLERIQIPKFDGDKSKFESFWAAFSAIVDETRELPKYKMLRLKACLEGKAAEVISRLGYSEEAYEEAKNTLKRKFGGNRRQIQSQLEDLRNMPPFSEADVQEIERFSESLSHTIVMLKEHKLWNELQPNSMLYLLLIEKIPRSMLSNYFRWLAEHRKEETLEALSEWMADETQFRIRALETREGVSTSKKKPARDRSHRNFAVMRGRGESNCVCCNKAGHRVWFCDSFKGSTVGQRWALAKEKQLCFRCLSERHLGKDCPRTQVCGINGCKSNHHRLLHEVAEKEQRRQDIQSKDTDSRYETRRPIKTVPDVNGDSVTSSDQADEKAHITTLTSSKSSKKDVSFRTVPVWLKANGQKIRVNAVLDDASSASYISEEVAGALGLSAPYEPVTVQVLNDSIETFDTMPVDLVLESSDGNVKIQFKAFTCPRQITGNYKVVDWKRHQQRWSHLQVCNFPEATVDPLVDVLIGQDQVDLHYSRCDVKGEPGEPIARLGPLGWSCIGNPEKKSSAYCQARTNFVYTFFAKSRSLEDLNVSLKRFWEVESVKSDPEHPVMSKEEKHALFQARRSLLNDGERYEVAVPWQEDRPYLSNNYEMAFNRLKNTEKRLLKNEELATDYTAIIHHYEQKRYVIKVNPEKELTPEGRVWFLPHFPVCRPDKTTTKTRIVFDASAKNNGISLNDTILPGPKLQNSVFNVLLRFRRYPIALACDIREMYLQIRIPAVERSYFRFLWRDLETDRRPDVYEFERIVFGDASAPFRAQFVAQENARCHKETFPLAAETIEKSTYMDDSLDSARTEEEAIELYNQLDSLWKLASMEPRKWVSNSASVLENIPSEKRASQVDLEDGTIPSIRTLGVLWLAKDDVFSFQVEVVINVPFTKRSLLSRVAKIFDPLGFISPFVLRAKILLQELWTQGLGWDDPVEGDSYREAKVWLEELEDLKSVRIPRCLHMTTDDEFITIHTFVDASKVAYGAVSYLRMEHLDGRIDVNIIASKTRVAPLTPVSIPRLELLAAVLGLLLTSAITEALGLPISMVRFWCDSMNVLLWIRGRGRQFRPFVANRVGLIQGFTNRGCRAAQLIASELWWQGPKFLQKSEKDWVVKKVVKETAADYKIEKVLICLWQPTVMSNDSMWRLNPTRWSSWQRLIHTLAWVLRFIHNCRTKPEDREHRDLKPEEVKEAQLCIIRDAQRSSFKEYDMIREGKTLSTKSQLLKLMPKMDEDGVLRCDGRLCYAEFLPYELRFPVILPRGSWVTKLIVKHYHEVGQHILGTNHTLANLSNDYWIEAGREEIRSWEKECNECKRRKAKAANQVMAPLPLNRLELPLKAFSRVSVDFAGPFITVQGRGKRREKRWLCLFTCLLCRAVHLEMAYGLDTDSFLRCFSRMTSRRGYPVEIVSDRGTNFIGAARELKELVENLDTSQIQNRTVDKGVKWTFNPPLAPHFGGVHEIMVKAAKKAIYAVLNNADVNDEELSTVFIGAEALLNSRPLTYQSSNPKDSVPLTPNHFLVGQVGGKSAPDAVDYTEFNLQKRWRRVQELISHFWKRWMREWLPMINIRSKWWQTKRDLKIGDVVLVISADQPRGHWPLGRVKAVFPGKDGHVRVAKVQIGYETVTRPITKLAPLEVNE